jgi:aspartate/glutamate racemase
MTMSQALVLERLNASGIWYLHRENKDGLEARSCRDAVTKRNRLGAVAGLGIPLWSELKSEVRLFRKRGDGEIVVVAAHCRANRQIRGGERDRSVTLEAAGLVASEWEIMPRRPAEESAVFGAVNPLCVDAIAEVEYPGFKGKVFQLFDESVFINGDIPDTMITNDGSLTKSIEFVPSDLFRAVKEHFPVTNRSDICEIDPEWVEHDRYRNQKSRPDWLRFPPPRGPKIGILTGNSPESGITLLEDILAVVRSESLFQNTATDINMPEILLYSCPAMGLTMELVDRQDSIWTELVLAIQQLIDAGCKLITAACNTTAFFQDKLGTMCADRGAKFVSIVDACLDELHKNTKQGDSSSKRLVGLLGIGPVIALDQGYSGYSKLRDSGNYEIVGADATDLAYKIKRLGDDPKKIKTVTSSFRKQVREELADVDQVIIGLTEASIVYRDHKSTISRKAEEKSKQVKFIDPVDSLSKRIVLDYLTIGYRSSKLVGLPEGYDISPILSDAVYGLGDGTTNSINKA